MDDFWKDACEQHYQQYERGVKLARGASNAPAPEPVRAGESIGAWAERVMNVDYVHD
jgi:hypothetical protein